MSKQSLAGILIALILGGVGGYYYRTVRPVAPSAPAAVVAALTPQEVNFSKAMRKLWEDHITWTRLVIVDIADGLASADLDTERLLKNYDDMEDVLKVYYDSDAVEAVGDLFKDHLVIAAELVKAAKAGDSATAADAEKRWFSNADDIAKGMSGLNPVYWPEAAIKDMMYEHLNLTKEEAVARLTKDYKADIAAYEKVHNAILMMADALSDGIVKQFPQKFGK